MSAHIVDTLSLGKIVQIRERLLRVAATGKRVYRLESGDPSFDVDPYIIKAMCSAAQEGKTHYIPNAGIPQLRAALKAKAEIENGIPVESVENVFVTNGAMHALFVAFQALLEDGSEVILPDPMWTEVAENIKLAGGVPVYVPLRRENGYEYDIADLERAITPRTKAIFVNTPHNPTGSVFSASTLGSIVDLAREHDLWIVSDEAYEHIIYYPNQHFSIASLAGDWADRVLSIFSFSKSYAMAGLRTGCLIAHTPLLCERIQKLLRCSINGVNSVAQWGALAALNAPLGASSRPEMIETYLQRRNMMMAALRDIPGVRSFEPKGTFFAWAEFEPSLLERLRLSSVEELSERLCEMGVGNTPGDAFGPGSSNAMRFSFSCETSMVEEGAQMLRRVLLGE